MILLMPETMVTRMILGITLFFVCGFFGVRYYCDDWKKPPDELACACKAWLRDEEARAAARA